jgi:hypothetical protein
MLTKKGSPKYVMLCGCAAQVGQMQGAAPRRVLEAGDPKAGRPRGPQRCLVVGVGCRATTQMTCLRKQMPALHV